MHEGNEALSPWMTRCYREARRKMEQRKET